MVKQRRNLEDCKICEVVDELCEGAIESKCDIIKAFLDTDPTPRQFIDKAIEVFGHKKTEDIMERLADDMGV